jgi:hypothetical protein
MNNSSGVTTSKLVSWIGGLVSVLTIVSLITQGVVQPIIRLSNKVELIQYRLALIEGKLQNLESQSQLDREFQKELRKKISN